MTEYSTLHYKIALTLIPGVGSVNGKNLVAYCGGVEAIFRERKHVLLKIPGIGEQTVHAITHQKVLDRALEEVGFIEKFRLKVLFYLDDDYPARLKHCYDAPLLLYYKGTADLNFFRTIAFVGTRKATEYGKEICRKLIEGLKSAEVQIVSGLAYGIDTWSHRAALENGIETVGVLGHSLDRIYPYSNRNLAERMIQQGGLLSEFISGTKPDRENFPMRNRIIAGLTDAVVVVEAGIKGGALITADIANSYDREVFAVPGRVGDPHSEGCNRLIQSNRAALIQNSEDILLNLNWDQSPKQPVNNQRQLFIEFTPEQEEVVKVLSQKDELHVDELMQLTGLLPTRLAAILLELEFKNCIKSIPGKRYKLL